MDYLDDAMRDAEEKEMQNKVQNVDDKEVQSIDTKDIEKNEEKILVGKVAHFFDKINVVAVELTGTLRIGDIIEIVNDEERIRLQVQTMQIDRKDVKEAGKGDDVGIKVDQKVKAGSEVYRIN
jgi:translation initiation factor IF-2